MTATNARRLTEFSHGAGCGCKLGPAQLATMLERLDPPRHPSLLVGLETGDDAAVWRVDDDRALVLTADFLTPVVDDPRTWGRIAAANAAGDVYAMGGRPLLALNLVAWNSAELGPEVLAAVLDGAGDAAADGGWLTVGGHSVDDPEPKFGLAVLGEVHPDRVLTNSGLRPGDALVLTKPLGVGVISTAIKAAAAPPEVVDSAVASMVRLNADAAAAAITAGAGGATDVTGFGLLGHLRKMAESSGVDAGIDVGAVPLLSGVRDLARDGFMPGGSQRNLAWVREVLDAGDIDEVTVSLLADAQTSGGLLFGAAPPAAAAAVAELRAKGHDAAVIGRAVEGSGRINLR
ncbi:MAG TPA: selenide, water dikinase SelD [Egibacteraceae bacterium]|nr:selenide, water dikinase SelD [Egibacteraceae bacterium]